MRSRLKKNPSARNAAAHNMYRSPSSPPTIDPAASAAKPTGDGISAPKRLKPKGFIPATSAFAAKIMGRIAPNARPAGLAVIIRARLPAVAVIFI